MSENDRILSTQGLTKDFGGIRALNKLDVVVRKEHIHGIIGPNGAGKSTFFNAVTGLLPPTHGKIYFESMDITSLGAELVTRMGISRTFQSAKLVPDMTVLENVMSGAFNQNMPNKLWTLFLEPFSALGHEKETKDRALETLEFVGMIESTERWASELVWVERQLVQIARALAPKPKLLLLDEPTSGMGIEESKNVQKIIQQIRDQGTTLVVVSHDVNLIVNMSDWVTAFNFGEKISEGTPEQIQKDSRVLEAYLGEKTA
jgi:ABC-type branched-subunit amino acid transport system ATPase component